MLRKFVGVAVALALVSGVALAEKEDKKGKTARGALVKCDAKKGTICILVKKDKDDEGTKTEYKITEDTKFLMSAGKGKKPTVVEKDEIKSTFKEGTMVILQLDEEGETATEVIAIPKKKTEDK